jgi:hypothetical protein
MKFVVKKTTELTADDENGILLLFNGIFKKERTSAHFNNQFLNNPLGYSFHSIAVDDGQIVGCNSYIPAYYLVNKNPVLFVVSVDTMIQKKHRDFFCLYEIVTTAFKFMEENGIACVYGFSNDASYPVFIKSKLMKDIGELDTYCLPLRVGGVKPSLKILNPLSAAFVNIYVFCASLFSSRRVYSFPIQKEAESYNATRYKRLDGSYCMAGDGGGKFVYKLMEYEGIKSVFLIDVFEKSPRNFNNAVKYIIKKHRGEFDVLLYVGHLPFRLHGMIRMPRRISPKKFHFIGKILKENVLDQALFFNIDHWDVNLSNYDLL